MGIVAVDPTSPFSGGAILGDRIRMRDLAGDAGVFVRSMASRGSLGGLAHTTSSVADALDAAGFELILIETVGAGQAEVDIARHAHTTLVIESPGMGDDIQAIKAGILEIADLSGGQQGGFARRRERRARAACGTRPWPGTRAGPRRAGRCPFCKRSPPPGKGCRPWSRRCCAIASICRPAGRGANAGSSARPRRLEARLRDRLAERWHAAQPDGRYREILARIACGESFRLLQPFRSAGGRTRARSPAKRHLAARAGARR